MHKYWRESLQYVLRCRDPAGKERFEGRVVWETDNGLTLTRPFCRLLLEFASSGKSFDDFLPTLLERLPEYGP
jgi:hypothetical protein